APQSGILRALLPLGAKVEKGQCIGLISDPLGKNEEPVIASVSGIIIGKINLPLVNEGEALYHIARFGEPETAAEAINQFQSTINPEEDQNPPFDL
ncbi:succinylglutamate desuccinylase, partial [Achromatium sp. WMS1]